MAKKGFMTFLSKFPIFQNKICSEKLNFKQKSKNVNNPKNYILYSRPYAFQDQTD